MRRFLIWTCYFFAFITILWLCLYGDQHYPPTTTIITFALAIIAILFAIKTDFFLKKIERRMADDNILLSNQIRQLISKAGKPEQKLEETINELDQESEQVEDKDDITEEGRSFDKSKINKKKLYDQYLDLIVALSEEILIWSKNKQYPSSVAVEVSKDRAEVIDFILDTTKGEIPIEVKVYPKKIISNNLPHKLKEKMLFSMKEVDSKKSLLVILDEKGITKRASEIIKENFDNYKIEILLDSNIHSLRKKFRSYLRKLEPQ